MYLLDKQKAYPQTKKSSQYNNKLICNWNLNLIYYQYILWITNPYAKNKVVWTPVGVIIIVFVTERDRCQLITIKK